MAGSRLQSDLVDRRFPWPQEDFCQIFLHDFTQFILDPSSKPGAINSVSTHNCLSHEARQSFESRIAEYVNKYLNYHTHPRDKPGHYPMERYMAQKEDDPWVTPRVLAQKVGQTPTADTESPGLDPRDSIHRAARDVAALGWPETGLDVSVVETTQERPHNTYLEKKVESFSRVMKQGGVADLNHAGPSSRSDVSLSGNGLKNTDLKQRGSSSCHEGFASPETPELKRRRNESSTSNKRLAVDQVTPSRRHNAGSKQKHKCPNCTKTFPFEARLKSHQAVHNNQKCTCGNCGSEFGRDSSLKRHQKTPHACEKKKETRLRQTSSQSAVGTRSESQNYFGTDAATSITSRSSCRESDCVSTDSPHDTRYNRIQLGSGLMMSDHTPASPRQHDQNYAYQNRPIPGPNYPQISDMGPPQVWFGMPGMPSELSGWEAETDTSNNNGCRNPCFDEYIAYDE